jgi:pyruvate-formate lyase-activating enzyme
VSWETLDKHIHLAHDTASADPIHQQHLIMVERTLIVDLTYRCNSPCRYCRWGNPKTEGRRDLPLDSVLVPPETLQILGTSRVVFSGGEPLLYPHLDDVLRYYARHVEGRVVITNGLLLGDDRRRKLRSAGANGFAFSIDTTVPRLYFATRGWRGEQLARVLGNVQRAAKAAEAEGLELGINAVVSRPTASWASVGALLAFGSSINVARVKFQPVFDDGHLSRFAPWLALDPRDVPNLLVIADGVGCLEGVNTNPPAFWRDIAAMAAGSPLDGGQCGLGRDTVLVTDKRLARCYWVPAADLGSTDSTGLIREHEGVAALADAKPRCRVDARCFCLQDLSHGWGGDA